MRRLLLRSVISASLAAALAGCVSAPPLDPQGVRADLSPYGAARATDADNARVIWGGMIVSVKNLADTTEIEALAYPLDSQQRPLLKEPTQGRFIVVLPGYVEAYDYPQGRFASWRGRVIGTREVPVGEHPYTFPLLRADAGHLWPQGFQNSGARWSIGVGVGFH